jgi:hypothetical protein
MFFWKLLLIATFLLFGGLALVVSIFGFRDVIAMFRNVERQHHAGEGSDSTPES